MTVQALISALLQQEGGFGDDLLVNEVQKAMWEFMKGQLSRRLEIRIDSGSAGFYSSDGTKHTVKLLLDGEVIDSDYICVRD